MEQTNELEGLRDMVKKLTEQNAQLEMLVADLKGMLRDKEILAKEPKVSYEKQIKN